MKPDKQPSFEELISELENLVQELDSSIGLEESLKKYERGMVLAKEAEKRLATIENQFEKLQVKFTEPAETEAPVIEQTIEHTIETTTVTKKPAPSSDIDLSELPF